MAVPANEAMDLGARPQGDIRQILAQLNNLVASFRLLTAKLDLDAGVTDANYNALITDSAIATAPKKIVG